MKIDVNKLKHVRTQDGKTTLAHPDGHSITLDHSKLLDFTRKQFEALAKSSQTPLQADEAKHAMADGGEIQDWVQIADDQKKPKKEEKPKIDDTKKVLQHKPPQHKDTNASRIDTGHGKVIRRYADGGDVDQFGYPKNTTQDKSLYDTSGYDAYKTQKKAEGGEIEDKCHACGGPVKHYDAGGNVAGMDDIADINKIAQKTTDEAVQNKLNEPQRELKRLTNNQVIEQHQRETPPGPLGALNANDLFTGANFENAPEHVSPEAVERAESVQASQQASKDAALKMQAIHDSQENAARSKLGLPQMPSLAGQEVTAGAQPQDQGPATMPKMPQAENAGQPGAEIGRAHV